MRAMPMLTRLACKRSRHVCKECMPTATCQCSPHHTLSSCSATDIRATFDPCTQCLCPKTTWPPEIPRRRTLPMRVCWHRSKCKRVSSSCARLCLPAKLSHIGHLSSAVYMSISRTVRVSTSVSADSNYQVGLCLNCVESLSLQRNEYVQLLANHTEHHLHCMNSMAVTR